MKHIKDNITIGSNIKHYRKLNKLTQKELGGLIGKTESSVQKYESGATEIPRSVLYKIASVLDVHLLDLLDDGSAIDWHGQRDRLMLSLYKFLGYTIDFGVDHSSNASISHGNNTYILPDHIVYSDLFEHVESDMVNRLLEIIERYATTSSDSSDKKVWLY